MTTTTATPFADAARGLHDRGWHPIPLPPGQKSPPPDGYTGREGRNAGIGQVEAWITQQPTANVATRCPASVIGIDVDHYGEKEGGFALTQWRERHNLEQLPITYVTGSRCDGVSGIYWFQISEACPELVGAPVSGVEIVQRHHRYAVMPPSLHPNGGEYRWINKATGEVCEGPPNIDELEWLPWPWIDALTKATIEAEPRDAVEWEPTTGTEMHPLVQSQLDRLDTSPGGRHDAMCAAQMALVRYESLSYPGATHALQRLSEAFCGAVAGERDGQYEFDAALETARAKVSVTASPVPPYEAPWEPPDPVEAPEADPNEGMGDWALVDIGPYMDDDWAPEPASLLTRTDGRSLFYRRNVNWLHGASGEGKTWVALIIALQEILARRHVLWIHYEDPEADKLVHRLRLLGLGKEQLLEFFHVVTVSSSMEKGMGQIRYHTQRFDIDAVIIDSIGEAIGADGIDVKQDERFTQWIHATARQLASDGCTVVGIDHLPMGEPARLDPIGSFRKKAATTGSMFLAEAPRPFSKDKSGYIRLTCAKDRSGEFTKGEVCAIIPIRPEGGAIAHKVKPPEDDEEASDRDAANLQAAKVKLMSAMRSPTAKPRTRNEWSALGGRKTDNLRAVQWAIDIDLLVEIGGGDPTVRGARLRPDKSHAVYVEDRPPSASDSF